MAYVKTQAKGAMLSDPHCWIDVTNGNIFTNGVPSLGSVERSTRKLGDVGGIFEDGEALSRMDPVQVVYRTEVWQPAPEGTRDVLQYGTSFIEPGRVGAEYFMTRGHLHARRESPEMYWGIRGNGVLVLQDDAGTCWAENVRPGSLHHIFGHIAHRLVNTGEEVLAVGACWPLDAGHDYSSLEKDGFNCRILRADDGTPSFQIR